MKLKFLSGILLLLSALWAGAIPVSPTRYDWSGLANEITSRSKTPYERARDIYTFLINNIAYDTSYSIHTADQTYEQRRGVCQGYCEMFYRIGEAAGLRVEIISGQSKDIHGNVQGGGHGWVFIYTNGNSGIFADPTWGAGAVNNGRFERCPTYDWFDVDPSWLIFSHFPQESSRQYIPQKISFSQFTSLPFHHPAMKKYGYNGAELLAAALAGRPMQTPTFYDGTINEHAQVVKIPLQKELRVGTPVEFTLRANGAGKSFVAINGTEWIKDWQNTGNNTYRIRAVPSKEGSFKISVGPVNNTWYTLIEYTVPRPTAADLANLENADPLSSSTLAKLENFDKATYQAHHVNGQAVLNQVKKQNIKVLPKICHGVTSDIISAPWNGILRQGQRYTVIVSKGNARSFEVGNEGTDIGQIKVDASGKYHITFTPTKPGNLFISAKTADSGNGSIVLLQYSVK